MEICTKTSTLINIITQEEYEQVPVHISNKIETYFEKQFESFLTAKALYESSSATTDDKIFTLTNELDQLKTQFDLETSKVKEYAKNNDLLKSEVESRSLALAAAKENISQCENEVLVFRQQRDDALDERNALQKEVEHHTTEIEILRKDLADLTAQLNAAINAKCSTLAKSCEMESRELNCVYREKQMKQQNTIIESRLSRLTEDLNKRNEEILVLRRDHVFKMKTIESKLAEKEKELQKTHEIKKQLTECNEKLTGQTEKLTLKVQKLQKSENATQEAFRQEIDSKTKLIELYKLQAEEKDDNTMKLTSAISELQEMLHKATEECGKYETQIKQKQLEYDTALENKCVTIKSLKLELEHANQFFISVKQENSLQGVTPSKLIKSGTTFTQIYSQYVQVSEELLVQKDESRRLSVYIETILHELKEKAPILRKQRVDYEAAIENMTAMRIQLDNMISESHSAREECAETKNKAQQYITTMEQLKCQITDMGRQVCFLTKLVHELKGDLIPEDNNDVPVQLNGFNASNLISKKLVTFSDIQELQMNNQQLLMLVREMSVRLEKIDDNMAEAESVELQNKINELNKRIVDLQDSQEQQTKLMANVLKQRDTYQMLYQDSMRCSNEMPLTLERYDSNGVGGVAMEDSRGKEVKDEIHMLKKQINELKEEYEGCRNEKLKNESMQHKQIEQMRKELSSITSENCKLVATNEYNDEKFKLLQTKEKALKNQISELDDKCRVYNNSIIKHEHLIKHLKDEVLNAQTKLSRTEVIIDNLQQENTLLKDTEARLKKSYETNCDSLQARTLLISNVEIIKESFIRSESEGRLRLEARLEEMHRECSALRHRLQEEQDRFRNFETQTSTGQLNTELKQANDEIVSKSSLIAELQKKLDSFDQLGVDNNVVKELQQQLLETNDKLHLVQNQLTLANEHVKQYKDISECAEKEVKNIQNIYMQYKLQSEKSLEQAALLEESLKDQIGLLEAELSMYTNEQENIGEDATRKKDIVDQLQKDLSEVMGELQKSKKKVADMSESTQIAEEKYAHVLESHLRDTGELAAIQERYSQTTQNYNQLTENYNQLLHSTEELQRKQEELHAMVAVCKAESAERDRLLIAEQDQTELRINELVIQNSALHDQIQTLSTQLAIAHASQSADVSLNISGIADSSVSNKSLNESDVKSSEQLFEIIKYLRKEKDIALAKFNNVQAEKTQLKLQNDLFEKQLEEANKAVSSERHKSPSEPVTTAKHTEIMKTIQTLNAITDHNVVLRQERDGLLIQVRELTVRISKLEEELAPLQENNKELQTKAEEVDADNISLKSEATHWRQRANVLVEKTNQSNTDDWKQLQNEKDALLKMLTSEKDAFQKISMELNTYKTDKGKYEERISTLLKKQQLQTLEMKRLNEEVASAKQKMTELSLVLNGSRVEASIQSIDNTKLKEEVSAKDVIIAKSLNKQTQLRRIAQKYKDLNADLNKKGKESIDKATVASGEGSSGDQETEMEPVKKEYEDKIKQLEDMNNSNIAKIMDKVSSLEEKNENLLKENVSLKHACIEKVNTVLKNAKQKISNLSASKAALSQDLKAALQRLESCELNKDKSHVCSLDLKSQSDERLSYLENKPQEENNLKAENISLSQQVAALQHQLRLEQSSKLSSSSDCGEKHGDMPTAHVKPSVSNQLQSAMIAPWQASTKQPLASIRPMTVAVTPISHNQNTLEDNESLKNELQALPNSSCDKTISVPLTSTPADNISKYTTSDTQDQDVPILEEELKSAGEGEQDNEPKVYSQTNELLDTYVVETTDMEVAAVDIIAMEATTVEAAAMETIAIQMTVMENTTLDTIIVEAAAVESSSVGANDALKATVVETAAVEATTVETTAVETAAMERTDVDKTAVETTAVETTAVETTAVETTAVQTTVRETTAVDTTDVENTNVETTTVETSAVETSSVEISTVEASSVETSAVETSAVETTAVETTAVETTAVETTAVDSSALETSASRPHVVKTLKEAHSCDSSVHASIVVEDVNQQPASSSSIHPIATSSGNKRSHDQTVDASGCSKYDDPDTQTRKKTRIQADTMPVQVEYEVATSSHHELDDSVIILDSDASEDEEMEESEDEPLSEDEGSQSGSCEREEGEIYDEQVEDEYDNETEEDEDDNSELDENDSEEEGLNEVDITGRHEDSNQSAGSHRQDEYVPSKIHHVQKSNSAPRDSNSPELNENSEDSASESSSESDGEDEENETKEEGEVNREYEPTTSAEGMEVGELPAYEAYRSRSSNNHRIQRFGGNTARRTMRPSHRTRGQPRPNRHRHDVQ